MRVTSKIHRKLNKENKKWCLLFYKVWWRKDILIRQHLKNTWWILRESKLRQYLSEEYFEIRTSKPTTLGELRWEKWKASSIFQAAFSTVKDIMPLNSHGYGYRDLNRLISSTTWQYSIYHIKWQTSTKNT